MSVPVVVTAASSGEERGRSESRTGMLSFLHGAAYTTLSGVFVRSMLLVNTIIVGRLLGRAQMGTYELVYAFSVSGSYVGLLGLNTSLTRDVAEAFITDKNRLSGIVTSAIAIGSTLIITLIASAILASRHFATWFFHDGTLVVPMLISALTVLPAAVTLLGQALLLGLGAVKPCARASNIASAASLPITVLLIVYGGGVGAATSLLIMNTLTAALIWREALKAIRAIGAPLLGPVRMREAVSSLSGAFPVFVSNNLAVPAVFVIDSIIARYFGLQTLGEFSVAMQLFRTTWFIPSVLNGVLLSFLTRASCRESKSEFGSMVAWNLRMILSVLVAITSVLVFCSSALIRGLYGSHFPLSVSISGYMLLATIPMAVMIVLNVALVARGLRWLSCIGAVLWFVALSTMSLAAGMKVNIGWLILGFVGAYCVGAGAYMFLSRDILRSQTVKRPVVFFSALLLTTACIGQIASTEGKAVAIVAYSATLAIGTWFFALTREDRTLFAKLASTIWAKGGVQ